MRLVLLLMDILRPFSKGSNADFSAQPEYWPWATDGLTPTAFFLKPRGARFLPRGFFVPPGHAAVQQPEQPTEHEDDNG